MFVDQETWNKLLEGAREMRLGNETVLLPRPEYLVALKLHAATSSTRSKPEVDWEDILQIMRISHLDLRYGGEDALAKIKSFSREG